MATYRPALAMRNVLVKGNAAMNDYGAAGQECPYCGLDIMNLGYRVVPEWGAVHWDCAMDIHQRGDRPGPPVACVHLWEHAIDLESIECSGCGEVKHRI